MNGVGYEIRDRVAHIILDRPKHANAFNLETLEAVVEAARTAERDEHVAVIVLRGAGKGFSAGHDLSGTRPDDVIADADLLTRSARLFLALWDIDKAAVGQVHGYCLGSAVDLTLACDLVITADDTRFGLPAMRGAGGLPPLLGYPLVLGLRRAIQFFWIQEDLSGREAVEWGLANLAVPEKLLAETAQRWAERIASMPPENIRLSKRALHRAMDVLGFRAIVQTGAEFDAIAHWGPAGAAWREQVAKLGISEAIRLRDEPFPTSS